MLLRKAALLKDLKEGKKISLNSVSSEALTCLIYILHFIVQGDIPISAECHSIIKQSELVTKLSKIRTKKQLSSIVKREHAVSFLTPFNNFWPNLLQNIVVKK